MFDELRDLYQETIVARSRNPRHGVPLAVFDASAEGDNPMCGDRCRVTLRRDADGSVAELGFVARGCAISIASADLMTDVVLHRAAPDIRALAARFEAMARTGQPDPALDGLAALSAVHEYPSRVKCATLPWRALLAAIDGATEATSE